MYRREQRRMAREQERISRANGGGSRSRGSPPRNPGREESISPPRYGPRAGKRPATQLSDDSDDDGADNAHHRMGREEWADKMAWMAAEAMGGNPFGDYGGLGGGLFGRLGGGFGGGFGYSAARFEPYGWANAGQRIPNRHQHPHAGPSRPAFRDAAREVNPDPAGPVPPLGDMTENEYAEWVREGMYRRRHKAELDDMERRRAANREKERQREIERENAAREERKRIDRLKRERGRVEEDQRRGERRVWRARCTALMDGEVVSMDLKFADIPWPAYTATGSEGVSFVLSPDDIAIDNVRTFLFALADDEAAATEPKKSTESARRKVLRDAILVFHPDRFFARVLPRVRPADQENVKEGVERCSRLINELLASK